MADDLHEAKVDIWDEDLCRDRLGYVYTDAMICARGRNNENTCKVCQNSAFNILNVTIMYLHVLSAGLVCHSGREGLQGLRLILP